MGAVIMVLAVVRGTMKNMKYFIRPEHFDAIGKLMLLISMGWAYFFFNDYMVQWYGGDKWTHQLLHFHEEGPMGWMWLSMLVFNIVIPWAVLWNRKWRSTPWIVFIVGLLINVGMWFERYIIIPVSLSINRMPFTWRLYHPGIEIPLGIGTLAFFILLYMAASRLIPLVPVWEVQEGQMAHELKKFGRETVVSVSELE
jgi:molybdopterin-containing oxidoreductase family membrane subunit